MPKSQNIRGESPSTLCVFRVFRICGSAGIAIHIPAIRPIASKIRLFIYLIYESKRSLGEFLAEYDILDVAKNLENPSMLRCVVYRVLSSIVL